MLPCAEQMYTHAHTVKRKQSPLSHTLAADERDAEMRVLEVGCL